MSFPTPSHPLAPRGETHPVTRKPRNHVLAEPPPPHQKQQQNPQLTCQIDDERRMRAKRRPTQRLPPIQNCSQRRWLRWWWWRTRRDSWLRARALLHHHQKRKRVRRWRWSSKEEEEGGCSPINHGHINKSGENEKLCARRLGIYERSGFMYSALAMAHVQTGTNTSVCARNGTRARESDGKKSKLTSLFEMLYLLPVLMCVSAHGFT